MNKKLIILFSIIVVSLIACKRSSDNSEHDEAVRKAKSIISRMTLREKVAQLEAGSFHTLKKAIQPDGHLNQDTLKKYYPVGFGVMNLDFRLDPKGYVQIVNEIQQYHQTLRVPVPVIFLGEGLHGLMSKGATVFPQAIALGCSWDTLLCRKVFEATAIEAHARGIRQLLSPVLDLAREPRFGRIEEMYSEDPYLVSQLGLTAVKGFQQEKPDGKIFVASTLKHFAGHGQPEEAEMLPLS